MWEDTLRKVKDLEGIIKVVDNKWKANTDSFLTKFEKYSEEVALLRDGMDTIHQEINHCTQEFTQVDQKLLDLKSEIGTNMSELTEERIK